MPISIYPPTLQSSQPAFLYTETSYPIYFTLQKITQFNEIGHIQVRLVKQSNNRSIVNTARYPDGIIYKSQLQIFAESGSQYYVPIVSSDLAESWQPGCLYKVQMRFGTTAMFTDISEFATWKKQQIDNQTFSEWSTVMVIKAISQPDVYIENAEAVNSSELISSERTEPTLTPLFFGVCNLASADKEMENKYKFDLYLGQKDEKDFEANPTTDLVETSGWLQHNAAVGSVDKHRFMTALTNNTTYTLFYSIQTVNGYSDMALPYTFLATKTELAKLEDVELRVDDQDVYCRENGCINLYLTTYNNKTLSGAFVITRTSEKSNFQIWEDLKYVIYSIKEFNDELIFQDFTIESGIKYKYAFQQENSAGLRTEALYEDNNPYHLVNFEYSYLYHNDVQLRLMFNQRLSSFKHTVLTSKQDTLGSKYPHLVKNGYAYYAEFPISGLISFQMDPDKTFLNLKRNVGYFYQDDLQIPEDKFNEQVYGRPARNKPTSYVDTDGEIKETPGKYIDDFKTEPALSIDTNLTDNNIFVERKFREKAEEFLNNFDYKLYKSPTEGNIVVVLQNVSLTPSSELGRMIYEFSATAYEVLENTIDNLNEYGIIDIGGFQSLASDESIFTFGQISGVYTSGNKSADVYSSIKEREEISVGGGYKLQLKRISSFWVERYPDTESILDRDYDEEEIVTGAVRVREICSAELVRLNAMLSQAKNDEDQELVEELETQILEYTNLQKAVREGQMDSTIILAINGKNIIVAPHKIYALTYPISSLEVVASSYPIIINYISELTQVEDQSVGVVSAIDASRIWGQIAGVFTDKGDIIKTGYNYNYGVVNQPPYRVYSTSNVGVIYDNNGNVVVDNTNYNVYKTLNLYEVIKEETRRQVEVMYGVTDGFYQDETGQWTDGTIQYNFSGIMAFDIEADPGTNLKISKFEDGKDAVTIKIGDQGRYCLAPMTEAPYDELVKYIVLESPGFVIANYKCLTTQQRMRT